MTQLLIVTGMHRSGTSLVAGVLRELGWDVGPDDDLMAPKPDNPRGFIEHLPAVRINDRLLYRRGGTWDDPGAFPPGWEQDAAHDDLREEARGVIDRLLERGSDRILLKDPRFSLTLPFWQTVTSISQVLLVLRPPTAVVASLLRRDDAMDAGAAARLWTRYLLTALRHDVPRAVMAPGTLVTDGADGIRRLAAATGTPVGDDQVAAALAPIEGDLWGRGRSTPSDGPDAADLAHAVRLHAAVTGDDADDWLALLGGLTPLRELTKAVDVDQDPVRHLSARLQSMIEQRDVAHERSVRLRDELDHVQAAVERLREELAAARGDVPDGD